MALAEIINPYKISGGITSKWVAIHNDVWAEYLRSDNVVSSASNSTGKVKLTMFGSNPATITVGGKVYISFYSGPYSSGFYNILSYTATEIVIDLTYTATASGFLVYYTDYTNYYVTIKYQYSNDAGATWIDYIESEYTPGTNMTFKVNFAPWLKSLVSVINTPIDTGAINDVLIGSSILTRVIYTENYIDQAGAPVSQAAFADKEFYILNAAKQICDVNGSNVYELITNSTPSKTMNWISCFEEPTRFEGYPFHLNVIMSELMTGISCDVKAEEFNGPASSVNINGMDMAAIGNVNRILLPAMTPNYTHMEVRIKKNAVNTYYTPIIKVNQKLCTFRNPIYLKWSDGMGGVGFFLFSKNQTNAINVGNKSGEFNRIYYDLETAETDSDVLTKDATKEIVIGADNLTTIEANGLSTLLYSVNVMMLTNSSTWVADGIDKWIRVKVKTGGYKITESKNVYHKFECTLQLPDLINISN